jgi:hypothetical protein
VLASTNNGVVAPQGSDLNGLPTVGYDHLLSYRAADAFPIYVGDMTVSGEAHVRHVRGERPTRARFAMPDQFPIPHYPKHTASLYELQALSREGRAAGTR